MSVYRSHGLFSDTNIIIFFDDRLSSLTTVLVGSFTLLCLFLIIHGEFLILATTKLLDICLAIRYVYLLTTSGVMADDVKNVE
jgi:hypothetical protein